MAELGDVIGMAVGRLARETLQSVSSDNGRKGSGPLSGMKGVAAGAGLAALVPFAAKGAGKLVRSGLGNGAGPVKEAGEKVGKGVNEAVGKSIDKAGGAGGMAKEAGKGLLPGGDGGGQSEGAESVPKGRQMPIQQAIDVAVPIQQAYDRWTQFEDWPSFMHRLQSVTQEDEANVSFKTKMWGFSREFEAEIVEQRPDELIRWRVTEGVTHTGVVSFHELSDRLTRVDVDIVVQPGSLIEKAARGMRHIKRAVRADMARFKAYVELEDEEVDGWRGEIEDGETQSSSGSQRSSASSRRRSSSGGSSSGGGRSAAKASGPSSRSSGRRRGSANGNRSSSNGRSGSSSGRRKSSSRSS
jgi:uncharacterized membrane protein